LQGLDEVVAAEAFGGDVEEFVGAAAEAVDALLLLLEVERAVDEGGGQVARVQCVHLILHQGDERGDDDRHALAHERGELVAERLAAARRHHDDRVVAFEDGLDDFALARAELLEPEELPQGRLRRFRVFGHKDAPAWWAGKDDFTRCAANCRTAAEKNFARGMKQNARRRHK
jgi:hypothetical protein